MPLSLRGKQCAITGTLKTMTRAEASQRLQKIGAVVSDSVSSKTDYLIAGSGAGSKANKAAMRGITVLNEDQLIAVLEGRLEEAEALATPPKEVATVPLNDALTAFRELLYDTPDAKTWERACALLDACDPASLSMAADYVAGLTAGWGGDLPISATYDGFPQWHKGVDLRQTPRRWMEAVLRGEDSPKLRVPRIFNMHNAQATGAVAQNMFKCSNLKNIHYLSLGRNKLPGAFFKALRQADLFAGVTHLCMDNLRMGKAHAQAWQGPSALTSITHLSLASSHMEEEEHLSLLLEAEAFREVHTLNLNNVQIGAYYGTGQALKALQHLKAPLHLEFGYTRPGAGVLEALFDSPSFASLRHLTMPHCEEPYHHAGFAALARAAHIQHLEHLDFYSCRLPDAVLAQVLRAQHLGSLRFLGLSGNRFGDLAAEALREATHLAQLKILNLSDCDLTLGAATQLLHAPHLASLEHLTAQTTARYDQIDDTFPLAVAAATHLRLQHFYSGNIISDDALLTLATAPHMASLKTFHLREQPRSAAFKERLLAEAVFCDEIKESLKRAIKTDP